MCLPYGRLFCEHLMCINSFNPHNCVKNFYFPDEELGMERLKLASGRIASQDFNLGRLASPSIVLKVLFCFCTKVETGIQRLDKSSHIKALKF